MSRTKVALIVGAGDGLGGAIARKFAREGLTACVVRRKKESLHKLVDEIEQAGGKVVPYGADFRDEDQAVNLIQEIESNVGPIDVAVHNIGANVNFKIGDTSSRVYRKVWEMACLSGFHMGREVSKVMVQRQSGAVFFTGATASLRGGSGFSAFSGAKFALRSLSQSMARELHPQGIHVAHVVCDGAIDTPWIQENFKHLVDKVGPDGIMDPDAVAENYWHLYNQPKCAWTQELDIRPYMEKF
ncbi:hypothetical protein SARC_03749 [Sphaeroforma arctica JP610]|uniref:Short-chain dehydrogenase n=1 Tax=Sphaeroforma arctica JP610 TaxID=667725 RepID=A0A0L0G4P6_9EUKA|nr:hypothetical protein SARC_03749 [Sphaeroforma arctica JP610]KNC84015.1 hypothetical protein SARC_03749 [Sphaeroforma arctica JP610]|eukprot:XP_014157917.1 hypothetical protein SARC_03749 [Sphaeroforma arctica JP610]